MTVAFGPMRPDERAFVASAWLRSYEHAELGHLSRRAYWSTFAQVVDGLLDTCDVFVARDAADATHAWGWLCRARGANVLHYVYVKPSFRDRASMGAPVLLASRLMGEAGLDSKALRCTFTTAAWLRWAGKHGLEFEHDRQIVASARAAARRAPREERVA